MANEVVNYLCPFCGSVISSNDVLFVDESVEAVYKDTIRFQFLKSCSQYWPFENDDSFRGLFFRVGEQNVTKRDKSGFPIELYVRRADGLTPTELSGDPPLPGENKPLDNGFFRRISTRVCPKCHCRLPGNFGIIPTIYVTMLGGRAAGKTAYLISLVHRLNAQLSSLNLGTATLLEESRTYYNFQNKYYQEHKGVTMPTPKDELLFPFIFEYNYLNSENPKSCFVAIYDLAGEGSTSTDYLLNHRGVQIAKTVLLMLDPNQLNNGLYASQLHVENGDGAALPHQENADVHDTFNTQINDFLANSVLSNRAHGIMTNVEHVIAVTTKIDQPMMCKPALFAGNCVLREDIGKAHQNRLDVQVLHEISAFLQKFYYSEGHGIDIVGTITNVFRTDKPLTVDLLAVSTWSRDMGSQGIRFKNVNQETGSKHRVVEPFLVILARSGMIPAEGYIELPENVKEIQKEIERCRQDKAVLEAQLKKTSGWGAGRLRRRLGAVEKQLEKLEDEKKKALKKG